MRVINGTPSAPTNGLAAACDAAFRTFARVYLDAMVKS